MADQQKSQSNFPEAAKKRSGFLSKAAGWVVSPYFFSKRDMNPLKVNKVDFERIGAAAEKDYQRFKSLAEVLAANPEFEAVRAKAIRALRFRRLALFVILTLAFLTKDMIPMDSLFYAPFMNDVLQGVCFFAGLSYLFVTDFQLVAFDRRVVGLTFFSWVRIRLGGK